jgi:hypothetical protein
MSGGGDSASTTTAAASSMTALAEQMRVAAEHEWLNQRVQVFWSANGAVTKRRGTVLAIRWLDSAALGAKDAKEFETLAIRSLAASVRFDDDEHAVFDGELVADLTHCLEEDDEENEFEEQQSGQFHAFKTLSLTHTHTKKKKKKKSLFFFFFFFFALFSAFARCSVCLASFATAELWNVHALFGVCKSAQNTLATDATVVNGNSDELFHSAAESKRASHAGSVLPSLVAELLTARSVSDAAAAVDPAAARLPLPDVLLADVYAALDGALADSFVASHRGELQQLLELSSTLLAEAPMLRDESWSLRAFVGAAAVGPTSLPLVRQGLQAACIVLRVALLRDSPPLSEEAFETSIRLARAVLTNGIAPLFDSSLEVLAKQNSKLGLAGADSSEPRARLSQLARAGATLISQVLVLLAHLVSHAAALVAQRHTGDVLLLSLTSLAQTALLIDPSSRALPGLELLQLAAISVFRTVFRRHPAHRTAILDDVLLALGRLPKTTKKSARTFRVVVSPPGRARTVETIHMTSALIVQLIQSCAAVPPLIEVKPAADEPSPPPPPAKRDKRVKQVRKATAKNAANDAAAAAIAAEFEAATSTASTATQAAPPDSAETPAQMARYFLATLVSRSAMPNKQERDEAGYKNVFDNLLQDLLLLWPLIEWPGAETALAVLVRVLLRGLSPLDGADDVSPQLRDMALSTLGSIATRVELVSGQVGALSLGHCGLACPCGDATKAVVNMACAACNAVFHVTCLAPDRVGDGVDAKRWRCDACLARAAVGALLTTVAPPPPPPSQPPPVVVAKPTKAKGRSKRTAAAAEVEPVAAETPVAAASAAAVAPDALDDELVATQVAFDWLNALVAAARDNGDAADALIDAEKAHVSRWLARFEALGRPLGAALMRHDYEHGLGAKPSALLLSESESQRVAAQVLVHSGALVSLFPLMLRALLVLLADKSKASRARALKALVGIVDANPRLLLEPSTRRAISDRCLDTATSVRDAALELIGKYLVLGDNELIEQFLPVTLERARDTGVSVRKRVVQILRELCVRVPGHRACRRSAACSCCASATCRACRRRFCARLSCCGSRR